MSGGIAGRLGNVVRALTGAPPAPLDHPPRTPDGTCIFAVGDIHGRLDLLVPMLAEIGRRAEGRRADGVRCIAVFLGDYVDRGEDSRGVLELLAGDPLPGLECRFLMGNHEAAMLAFLRDPGASAWLHFGGVEALASYGIRVSIGISDPARCRAASEALARALPDHHRNFLEALSPMTVLGDYAFVHAGIRPGRALARQRTADLLIIRDPFLEWPGAHEKFIVHGHTISDAPDLRPNRLGIDTGAYATNRLTAVQLEGRDMDIMHITG